MRRAALLVASTLALVVATPAAAGVVQARDGRFEAEVSASQMSRIAIQGEKIVSVRKMDDPEGPQVMLEVEEATGDVYAGFDGDVIGRSFSVFLVTESGKTVQALLRPSAGEGATVLVRLEGGASAPLPAASAAAPSATLVSNGAVAGPRADRRAPYPETLTAFIRLMFNGDAPEGVLRRAVSDNGRQAGPFRVALIETFEVAGLRGQVIAVTNAAKVDAPLSAEPFLVEGVLAAATSHEMLRPGESARVYIVEEAGR